MKLHFTARQINPETAATILNLCPITPNLAANYGCDLGTGHEMLRVAIRRDRGFRPRLARVAVRVGWRGTNEIRPHRAAAQQCHDRAEACASLD